MQKALVIDPGKCTGCKQCEMACSYENEGEFNPSKSRIRVFDFHAEGKMVPYTCTQCAEAWCQQACPVNAITTDSMGVKVVPWTVNDEPDLARLLDWKVDGLITDYPDRLRALMKARGMALPTQYPAR